MSQDAFAALLRRLRAEADDNVARSLDFIDRPFNPDDVVNPPNTLVEYPSLRQLLARELLRLESENIVAFNEFVREQIQEAERAGTMTMRGETTYAREGTLITLLALAVRQDALPQGRHAPFYVLSLFRARGGSSPHDHGLGIDLIRYNGHNTQGPTLESFRAAVTIVRNLPAGNFELGLPRAPRETWDDFNNYRRFRVEGEYIFRQDQETPEFSPRFRRPGPLTSRRPSEAWSGPRESLNPDSEIRRSPSRGGGFSRDLEFFDHPGLARQFHQAAAESEGRIRLVFPDEPNHIHITVDIDEVWTRVLDERRNERRGGSRAR